MGNRSSAAQATMENMQICEVEFGTTFHWHVIVQVLKRFSTPE